RKLRPLPARTLRRVRRRARAKGRTLPARRSPPRRGSRRARSFRVVRKSASQKRRELLCYSRRRVLHEVCRVALKLSERVLVYVHHVPGLVVGQRDVPLERRVEAHVLQGVRSEERRVGKECRVRRVTRHVNDMKNS